MVEVGSRYSPPSADATLSSDNDSLSIYPVAQRNIHPDLYDRPPNRMDGQRQAKIPEAAAPGIDKCGQDLAAILKVAQVKSAPEMGVFREKM